MYKKEQQQYFNKLFYQQTYFLYFILRPNNYQIYRVVQQQIFMRKDDMKIAPLSQLYQQKSHYQAHRQKIQSIMSAPPSSSKSKKNQFQKMELVRQNLCKFQKKMQIKSVELAKENYKFVRKLQNIKSAFQFKRIKSECSQSSIKRSISAKSKLFDRQRQKSRLKQRIKWVSSGLSKKNLLKDYDQSMRIKNRIMRYQTQTNNKVSLKTNKLLSINQHRSKIISANISKKKLQNLPKISPLKSKEKLIVQQKLQKYLSSEIKNRKVQIKQKNHRKFKLFQEKQNKTEKIQKYKSSLNERQNTFCTSVQNGKGQ